jgi:hypothetical protein
MTKTYVFFSFFFLLLTIIYNKICRCNHDHLDASKSPPKWDNKDNEVEEDKDRHGLDMCQDACRAFSFGMLFFSFLYIYVLYYLLNR